MAEQGEELITSTAVIEPNETQPSEEWFSAHRTTAEEQESARWLEGRTQEIESTKALKNALGQSYGTYRAQLETMTGDERAQLVDKSPEEIASELEYRAETQQNQKKLESALEEQRKEQAEANLRASETPELREVRRAAKASLRQVASLDEQIAKLARFNELRNDITAKDWDDLPTEDWVAAREGTLESYSGEIGNLIQEKQAKLQEATLHQSAYNEGMRALQAQQGYAGPAPNIPIGQIVGNNGQPVQLTTADIATLVQYERDEQAHQDRVREAIKHYPDWNEAGNKAVAAGIDISDSQAAFVKSLPNSADVTYYLLTHPDDTMALSRMNSHEATRALITISHKAARPSAPAARTTTSAPKPPSPVGGGSSRAFDVGDESLSADAWFHQRNRQLGIK
jgi:hypothetical protein